MFFLQAYDGIRVDLVTGVQTCALPISDNKGQHLANALGALDAVRAETAQWTVKIILDGEEEHGSPNLTAIAQAHRARSEERRVGKEWIWRMWTKQLRRSIYCTTSAGHV